VLCPDPAGPVLGELSTPPDPIAGFKGPTYKRREGRERERKEGEEM